ncbi:MAG: CheR family methyltransferase [Enhygromyxa sp.]
MGASAGGLEACKQLLEPLTVGSGLAFIVIMHLDPVRTSHLAEVLAASSQLPVVQVTEAQRLEPDHVYVIAPNTSLEFVDHELRPGPPLLRTGTGGGVIDLLFSSLAAAYGEDAAAIVLSGIGSDGSAALADFKAAGGLCLAQEPATAEHPAMPNSAIATGEVDIVLAPQAMAAYLVEFLARPKARREQDTAEREAKERASEGFDEILRLLATHHNFDARNYKKGTLARRAQHRLTLLPFSGWPDYLAHVQEHPEELAALYQDVLIGVTEFFRDPEQWVYLERDVIPRLLDEHQDPRDPVRVWSAGCASGEEAYSLAMVFLEQIEERGGRQKLQVFGTDVSQKAIALARRALYPDSIADRVSPGRLAQFFDKRGDSYQVNSRVRDVVTLAQHDVLVEPPFSRLDLVSCRNLFIYLEPHAQQACIERFYFALRPKGVLWLGGSETVGRHIDLFTTLSSKYRLFRKSEAHRTNVSSWNARVFPATSFTTAPTSRPASAVSVRSAGRITRMLELHVLEHYVAPCVVVNEAGNVLHLFGPTARYVSPPVGEVRLDLLSWVHDASLYAKLRPALKRAVEQHETVRVGNVQLRRGAEQVRVEVSVEPIPAIDEGVFLVSFSDQPASAERPSPAGASEADEALVDRLSAQLQDTQAELQSTLDELDNANEEYRASYEELVSLNEELQSSNEELETTKEEAQSINEELLTVNRELEERNEKLRSVNADLENLLALTTIPTVFLDRQLRVRRYTPAAERAMWLVPSDVGRPIQHIQKRVQDERMIADAVKVLDELVPLEAEVRADDGRWYLRKIVPFRAGDRIDGVCMIFYDITAQKLAAEQSDEARYFAESIVRSSTLPFVVFNHELEAVSANEAFYQAFATSKERVESKPLSQLGGGGWDIPQVRGLLERVVHGEVGAESLEFEQDFEQVGHRNLRLTVSLLERSNRPALVLMSIEDLTPLRAAQHVARKRTEEQRRKDEFLAMLGHELRNPLAALVNGLALLERVGTDPEQLRRICGVLDRQAQRMMVLLDQLLDIARVSSGKIELDLGLVDLVDVARAALEGVQPMVAAAKHELVLTLPDRGTMFVKGDFVRLVQVVENLLSNAVKNTEDHGTIWLTIDALDDSARIRVRDTGVGIDPDLLPRIFDVFAQGIQRLDRAKGGLGLGLALVRQLVDLHGGRVEAHSAGPDQGSEFTLLLPRIDQPEVEGERSPAQLQLADIPALRVLVVDDEPDGALSLAELLRSYGHEVRIADDGRAALELASSFGPRLVLLDLGLPDIDGYELAPQLRERLDPAARIVAVTGYRRDDERLREAGFDGHLIKPPSPEQLAEQLGAAHRAEGSSSPKPPR